MEIREDKYLAGDYQGNLFIKIVGNATMKNSKTLDALFDKVFAGGQKDIILDFEECNYMDSTMLGLIKKTLGKINVFCECFKCNSNEFKVYRSR